jgi:2-phosphosulfolactate phosphatase
VVELGQGGAFGQSDADVRFEWGPVGAAHLTGGACVVVIDVLSFTTAVSVVTSRGMAVYPQRWDDPGTVAFAAEHDAQLVVRRRDLSAERPWSLSPAVLRTAPVTPRLVMPSPNGSTISVAAAATDTTVVAASLRNASAVGRWLVTQGFGTSTRPAVIIAAGEKWRDGSLRPALEDGLGAGAVLHHLRSAGAKLSVEADAMAGMFGATGDVEAAVRSCGSARQLVRAGYGGDVDVAVELDSDDTVPVVHDGAFTAS